MTVQPGASVEDFEVPETPSPGYQSPLMARMAGSGKLTLDLLRRDVPVFQRGEDAARRLADADHDPDEADTLNEAVAAGERAKERLVLAGIPLIKHLAKKEHQRRQNWQTQVTFEDLVQEGCGGFLRGLRAYNPYGAQKSATNYLGQWILTDMRRNVETIDNDFGVAYDTAERFRKIRAIRSRLASTLGREPTDAEVLEAAADPMFRGGHKIGRVKKATTTPRRTLTQEQLDQERDLRARVGMTSRFADPTDDDATGPLPEQGQPLYGEGQQHTGDPDTVVEEAAKAGLARLMVEAFGLLGLPSQQREIISRRFGLPPFVKEHSARDISRDLDLHREKVSAVLDAFTEEMARPGGAFHRACSNWNEADLMDLGLGWTLQVLGAWTAVPEADRRKPVAAVLRTPLATRSGVVPPPPEQLRAVTRVQVRAQFVCDYHADWFVGVYATRADVPTHRACPQCGDPAPLVRVAEDRPPG